jgi:hypothetical protein
MRKSVSPPLEYHGSSVTAEQRGNTSGEDTHIAKSAEARGTDAPPPQAITKCQTRKTMFMFSPEAAQPRVGAFPLNFAKMDHTHQ